MGDSLKLLDDEDVVDIGSFIRYSQQRLGIPPMQVTRIAGFRKQVNNFFETYPHADYGTLVKIVRFAKSRKFRPKDMFALLALYKQAWTTGNLPELDPREYRDPALQAKIEAILKIEEHPLWVHQLEDALWFGNDKTRAEVYQDWVTDRKAAGMSVL